jgi:hypothetical protein
MYVLTQVGDEPVPAILYTNEAVSVRVLADTLIARVRVDGLLVDATETQRALRYSRVERLD